MTLTQQHSEAQLALLPADSHANLSVLPDSDEARRMTVQSGRKCSALLRNAAPDGLLVRTLLASSIWRSTMCLFRWRVKATKRGRLYFQLVPSVRGTSASAFSSSRMMPTPNAAIASGGGSAAEAARALTNEKRKSGASISLRLSDYAKLFPTPAAQMERGSLIGELMRQGASGSLNPQWVEWLMGYPEDWTYARDSKPSETQ